MAFDFNSWIRQPTTLHALGVVAAGVGVALTHLATGNPTWDAVVGVVAYVLVHLGIDDNSAAEQAVTAVASDVVSKADPNKLVSDVGAAVSALRPAAPPSPPKPAA